MLYLQIVSSHFALIAKQFFRRMVNLRVQDASAVSGGRCPPDDVTVDDISKKVEQLQEQSNHLLFCGGKSGNADLVFPRSLCYYLHLHTVDLFLSSFLSLISQ